MNDTHLEKVLWKPQPSSRLSRDCPILALHQCTLRLEGHMIRISCEELFLITNGDELMNHRHTSVRLMVINLYCKEYGLAVVFDLDLHIIIPGPIIFLALGVSP
jgi:hypothetical protein